MLFRGQPVGMGIDVLRELTGPRVQFEARGYPNMASLVDAGCDGEVDIVTNVTRSADRNRCLPLPSRMSMTMPC
jgi:two-component system sensor histidine kinase EvgS